MRLIQPHGMLISNDEVANLVAAHPDRFSGVAAVDLRYPAAAVQELRRGVDAGLIALRIVPWLWNLPPDDRRYYPLYATCVELGIPFCTQTAVESSVRPAFSRAWQRSRSWMAWSVPSSRHRAK